MSKSSILSSSRLGFKPEINPPWMITPNFGITRDDVEVILGEIEADIGNAPRVFEPHRQWTNTYEVELQVSEGLYPAYLIVEVSTSVRVWYESRPDWGEERLEESESKIIGAHVEVQDEEFGTQRYNLSPLGMAVLRKAMGL